MNVWRCLRQSNKQPGNTKENTMSEIITHSAERELMKAISTQFFNQDQDQSWVYETIVDGSPKLRVVVRRDGYDHQSYARGFALDPVHLKWNLLVDHAMVPGIQCYEVSHLNKNISSDLFESTANSVLRELRRIVKEIAFKPTQIKSTGNRGTFDPDNPNIK